MAGGNRYAKGKYALGECARSGRKMLLKNMVADGYYPNLIVDPAWREEKHPQEYLPMVEDPVGLYRPSPERLKPPSTPVLSGEEGSVVLNWTESITARSQITLYDLFRKTDDGEYSLLTTVNVERDAFGGITGNPLTYTDDTVDLSSHSYTYRVQSHAVQGPPSALSNEVLFEQSVAMPFTVTVGLEEGFFGYSPPFVGSIDPDPPVLEGGAVIEQLRSDEFSPDFSILISEDIRPSFTLMTVQHSGGLLELILSEGLDVLGDGTLLAWENSNVWGSDDVGVNWVVTIS